jgi:NAD(P)-dependent dehydrogenase (short-subunit alcohol dehydrogenase family)
VVNDFQDNFRGKRVLVTGGTRGIGLATVEAFLAAGARVAVNGRTQQSVDVALAKLPKGKAIAAPGDIGKVEGCRAAVATAERALGGLDVLVNSAGVFKEVTIEDSDEAWWDQVLDTNLKGTFFTSKAALPALRASKGCIVNLSSESGIQGSPRCTVYCASKGGVTLLTKAMALEVAPDVRVNAVCPGPVDTDMLWRGAPAGVDEETYFAGLNSYAPMKRIGRPDEIAAAVLYLASPAAGFITGTSLSLDGGSTAGR